MAERVDVLDVPEIRHPPESPLLKVIVLEAGIAPQATVIGSGGVITGSVAGSTVMILVTGASGL